MKVAILSESPADEAAVRVLVGGLMEGEASPVAIPALRRKSWPSVLEVILAVILYLHYQTDADAFVAVVDSNSSPVYPEPPPSGADVGACRLHRLRKAVRDTLARCRQVPGREAMKVAIGVAVPAVEAWYLCGIAAEVTENAWLAALGRPSLPSTKAALKQRVYGTDRPNLRQETEKARECALRIAGNLALLEERFPIGFGSLARDVRAWAPGRE